MSLYVKVQKTKNQKIVFFLKQCYIAYVNKEEYRNGPYAFCETYEDPEYKKVQNKPAARSMEMLYEVVKTYYPGCTVKHFFKQLRKLLLQGIDFEDTNYRGELFFCTDIKKWVIAFCTASNYDDDNSPKSFKFLWDFSNSDNKRDLNGSGVYSYNQIMSNMGYSEEEIKLTKENTNS